jgi:hypothetical protein
MLKAFFLNEAIKTLDHFGNPLQASYITTTQLRYCAILAFSTVTLNQYKDYLYVHSEERN